MRFREAVVAEICAGLRPPSGLVPGRVHDRVVCCRVSRPPRFANKEYLSRPPFDSLGCQLSHDCSQSALMQ
eukprot:4377061-Pyramimonas_sp.AAC.1